MTTLDQAPPQMIRPPGPAPSPWLHRILLANVVVEVLIVVTGGLVRLTGSGLGCPTWPQCTPGSYVPVREQAEGFHKYIEFGNRTLTGLVGFVALAAVIAIWRWTDRRRALLVPAVLVLAGVAVQAILGGITVRTGLNPATVAAHFLVSMGLIAAATAAYVEGRMPPGPRHLVVPGIVRQVAWATTALAGVVLVLGTIVTGSGPHSGDADQPARLSFDPRSASWLHADSVMLFVGLVIAMVVATHLVGRTELVKNAWRGVLFVTLAQGVVGYTQYFTKLPEALVLMHMLLASLLVIALVNGLKHLRGQAEPS
ncbi:MAG: COX15/CtaA family protein [Actinobacteria bacterium]|uniref:COX15/CtaA family protein n=1 Tax=Nostocoides veronense TaxID=330836 RepID=A0ABN2M3B2_9MICO|nr:COX15/CtaA family protein [Actinomycetota bacterium]